MVPLNSSQMKQNNEVTPMWNGTYLNDITTNEILLKGISFNL